MDYLWQWLLLLELLDRLQLHEVGRLQEKDGKKMTHPCGHPVLLHRSYILEGRLCLREHSTFK
jgi:hypothetical protein